MAQEYILKNKLNNKTFRFINATTMRNRMSQPALTIPIINSSYDNTLLFRLIGQTRIITARFVLIEGTTDLSDATAGYTVGTLEAQKAYLQDVIYGYQFDCEFQFYTTSLASMTAKDGVLLDIEWEDSIGPMKIAIGTLTFQYGQVNLLS